MIRFRRIDESGYAAVSHLAVTPEQRPFVGSIESILRDKSPGAHCYVIQLDKEIAGFFIIDTCYSSSHPFASERELGLRSFFIDRDHQGKGFGRQATAMLKAFLRNTYPDNDSVALTVNRRNGVARHCYLAAGFSDTGELYDGPAGPKHILRMKLV